MAGRPWLNSIQLIATIVLVGVAFVRAAIDPSIQLTVNSTSIRDGDMVKVRANRAAQKLSLMTALATTLLSV